MSHIVAAVGASHTVQFFVDALNRHIYDTPPKPAEKAGTKRRIAREKAQAKAMKGWHQSAQKARKNAPVSRQVRRRMERDQIKSTMAASKRQAIRDRTA